MIGTYRHAYSIAPNELTLLGPRPSAAEAGSAWDKTATLVGEVLQELQRPAECLERAAVLERARARQR